MSASDRIIVRRWHVAVLLLLVQLWPIHMVVTAYSHARQFSLMFADLGVALPGITRFFFRTYRFWIGVPVVTGALALASLHPKVRTMALPVACLAATLVSTYMMYLITTQAIQGPLLEFVEAVNR